MHLRVVLIAAFACGGEQVEVTTVASNSGRGTTEAACGDPVLADQVTSGGQRVITWQPCFDAADESAIAETEERVEVEGVAPRTALAQAALPAACDAVPLRERTHSPLAHKRAIDRIEPIYDEGQLAGVRVVFKRVRGLNAEWVRRGIACQRARWAVVANEPGFSPSDPTLVEGADANVIERDGRVEVIITAETPDRADIVLARARGELSLRNARR